MRGRNPPQYPSKPSHDTGMEAGFNRDRLPGGAPPFDPLQEEYFAQQRQAMVQQQLVYRGISNPQVLKAMARVPRHRFVPPQVSHWAYRDTPLEIGYGQTISQPYIVAYMTEQAAIPDQGSVLEIGTGSGYQAAVLSRLCRRVYSVEIIAPLAQKSQATLQQLGYDNVHVKHGNGYQGWGDHAPYDAILLTAAPPRLPSSLVEQLTMGGRLVAPVGDTYQSLQVITKTPDGLAVQSMLPVRFVAMVGETRLPTAHNIGADERNPGN
jgi:protein-L-isoaspartate(D-aspartate) O-methyltransferase